MNFVGAQIPPFAISKTLLTDWISARTLADLKLCRHG
jgi:hypothetical protein